MVEVFANIRRVITAISEMNRIERPSQATESTGEVQNSKKRILAVDALRGLASLSVCLFHLVWVNGHFIDNNPVLLFLSKWAHDGVFAFFVISGFVIPYSMFCSNYHWQDAPRFLLKRVVRIDPPYLISVALVLGLNYLSSLVPALHDPPFQFNIPQVLAHVGYLNAFLGMDWLQVIYWTLAIEFQYYLTVAVLFPLIDSRSAVIANGVILLFALTNLFITQSSWVFDYAAMFAVGIATFRYRVLNRPVFEYLGYLLIMLPIVWKSQGLIAATIVGGTSLAIIFWKPRSRLLIFFGLISYSLYLVHIPFGVRLVSLAAHLPAWNSFSWIILILICGLTILFAWIFYLIFERPSINASKSILPWRRKLPEVSGLESVPLQT
jgi:peptidoglycan/LPS O-acetylase OafA/YrhL